jgi:hypothetical protein
LTVPNKAIQLAKTMGATACAQNVCLVAENNRPNYLVGVSTRYHDSVANQLCPIPLNRPALLLRHRRPYRHSKPIT